MPRWICMSVLPIKPSLPRFFLTGSMFNLLTRLWIFFTGASFGIRAAVQMNRWHTGSAPSSFVWSHLSLLPPSSAAASCIVCSSAHVQQSWWCLLMEAAGFLWGMALQLQALTLRETPFFTAHSFCLRWGCEAVRFMGRGNSRSSSPSCSRHHCWKPKTQPVCNLQHCCC